MNNTLLKIFVLGGVGYLIYKYYYLPSQSPKIEYPSIEPIEDDGRSTFYGISKSDYVRGFRLPDKIKDIKYNKIYVITKPNEKLFGLSPRTMFEINLNTDTNRVIYSETNKDYIADYDKIKNKIVMSKDYTKLETNE
jgi:hypothetical protein